MTKQHLVAFASEIRNRFNLTTEAELESRDFNDHRVFCAAYSTVVSIAKQFNPKFDEARFRAACFSK